MSNDDTDNIEILKLQKEVWEKAVDTQMHFNEMCVKSRQLGLTFVVAALGLSVLFLIRDVEALIVIPVPLSDFLITTHLTSVIILIAAAGLYAVKRLDLGVYHRMLRGAVTFGEELEQGLIRDALMKTPYGMTEFISLYSRHHNVDVKKNDSGNKYTGKEKITAEKKINRFYWISIGSLLTLAIAIGFAFFTLETSPSGSKDNASSNMPSAEHERTGPTPQPAQIAALPKAPDQDTL